MWKIWKEEFYKAASRKIVWLGVILLLAFLSFRLFAERDDYSMTLDGKTYFGQTAIEKDKQLAKKYAGVLTREKIRQIYDTYGFYYYDAEKDLNSGNFLSRFITEKFTNFMRTDGDRLEDIHFLNGKDWENNVEPYLEHEVRLDYIYGWNDFIEMYMVICRLSWICGGASDSGAHPWHVGAVQEFFPCPGDIPGMLPFSCALGEGAWSYVAFRDKNDKGHYPLYDLHACISAHEHWVRISEKNDRGAPFPGNFRRGIWNDVRVFPVPKQKSISL